MFYLTPRDAGMPYPPGMPESTSASGLGVVRGRVLTRAVLALLVLGAAILAWWFVTNPPPLPTAQGHVTASTTAGRPVYLGVWTAPAGLGRTLDVAGVHLRADTTTGVVLEPLLCRGGSIGVTSDPAPFCRELVDPAGATMRAGDSLVLRAVAQEPGAVYIDLPTIAFREGPRWGRSQAGTRAVIAVVAP